jgi:hypothetical protein
MPYWSLNVEQISSAVSKLNNRALYHKEHVLRIQQDSHAAQIAFLNKPARFPSLEIRRPQGLIRAIKQRQPGPQQAKHRRRASIAMARLGELRTR